MSMSEHELAGRIVQRLQSGLDGIEPRTLARLRSARATAVERIQPEPASVLAWAGAVRPVLLWRRLNPRYLLPIVGMVLTVSAMVYWQQRSRIDDPVDIDAKLLASEVPIGALLDKGLDAWLTR